MMYSVEVPFVNLKQLCMMWCIGIYVYVYTVDPWAMWGLRGANTYAVKNPYITLDFSET